MSMQTMILDPIERAPTRPTPILTMLLLFAILFLGMIIVLQALQYTRVTNTLSQEIFRLQALASPAVANFRKPLDKANAEAQKGNQ